MRLAMSKLKPNRLTGIVLIGLLSAACPAALSGQDEIDPQIQRVLADWKKRRSYPTVEYEVEGHVLTLKEWRHAYIKTMKRKGYPEPKDTNLVWNAKLLLDVKGQRHRYEEDRESYSLSSGTIRRQRWITAFDGSMLTTRGRDIVEGKEVKKKPTTPDVSVITGNLRNVPFPAQLEPLFNGHGVVLVPPQGDISPGNLDFDPEVALLTVDRNDVYAGRTCLVLRSYPTESGGFQEYWIDTSRDSALLRRIAHGKGFPVKEVNVRYKSHGGYWLPDSWTCEWRNWYPEKQQAQTESTYSFTIKKASLQRDVDVARFRIPIEPGMLITKTHNEPDKNPFKEGGKMKHFRIDPSSAQPVAVEFEKGKERRPWTVPWRTGSIVALALSLVGYGAWRWTRGRTLKIDTKSQASK